MLCSITSYCNPVEDNSVNDLGERKNSKSAEVTLAVLMKVIEIVAMAM